MFSQILGGAFAPISIYIPLPLVRVHGLAAVEPTGVEGDNEEVVEEVRGVLAVLEAVEVEVQQGANGCAHASFTDVM